MSKLFATDTFEMDKQTIKQVVLSHDKQTMSNGLIDADIPKFHLQITSTQSPLSQFFYH